MYFVAVDSGGLEEEKKTMLNSTGRVCYCLDSPWFVKFELLNGKGAPTKKNRRILSGHWLLSYSFEIPLCMSFVNKMSSPFRTVLLPNGPVERSSLDIPLL